MKNNLLYVVDSSVVIAYFLGKNGENNARKYINNAVISSVNYTEIISRLYQKTDISFEEIIQKLEALNFNVMLYDRAQAISAAQLHASTRSHGLSYGDCACLALALEKELPAVTADKEWTELDIDTEVICIR